MRILHTSDLHGRIERALDVRAPFDVWVDTGDFFPNVERGEGEPVDAEAERAHQRRWLRRERVLTQLRAWLGSRPMLWLAGNHDFLDLAAALRDVGIEAHAVTPEGVQVRDLVWAGFRHIRPIDGEWPGETDDFRALIERTVAARPDVLLTHAPPKGVLDGDRGFGIPALGAALGERLRPRAHLFGHEHRAGGKQAKAHGIRFANSAQAAQIVEI